MFKSHQGQGQRISFISPISFLGLVKSRGFKGIPSNTRNYTIKIIFPLYTSATQLAQFLFSSSARGPSDFHS